MSGFEWFLLVVVVILVPLVVAVAVTLWTLEQARQRKRQNREVPADGEPVKRRATRDASGADSAAGEAVVSDRSRQGGSETGPVAEATPDGGGSNSGGGSDS